MRSLAPHVDWLLVDVGHQPSEITSHLWASAERVVIVTSPDAVAVMDTYALIKTLLSRQPPDKPLALVVNQVEASASAADVHRRIDRSCRRFLGLSIELAAEMPLDPVATAVRAPLPLVLAAQGSQLAEAVSRLTRQLTELRRTQPVPQRRAA